jgi:hypothetical protein
MAANIIKSNALTTNKYNQTKGTLVHVQSVPTREILGLFEDQFHDDYLPRGTCIICTYVGNKHASFQEIKRYGSATLLRLKKEVGQTFEIDYPPSEHQTEIELTNQEARE